MKKQLLVIILWVFTILTNAQSTAVVNGIVYNYHYDGIKYAAIVTSATCKSNIVIPFTVKTNRQCVVTAIGPNAFSGCSELNTIVIPSSVTSIGSSAFSECTGLNSISIPSSVTTIGSYAFSGCTGLSSVRISDLNAWCRISFESANSNPLYMAHHLFLNDEELKDLVIPQAVSSIKSYAFSGNDFNSISVEEGNTVYDSRDNCNAIINTETNTLVAGCNNTIIPNNVTIIGQGAFSGCSDFTSIVIPEGVTTIEKSAFEGCKGLTSITIPEGVTTIGDNAFYGCI